MRYIIIIMLLSSCSATHHFNKAIDKGLKIDTITKTIETTDIITINGKDSIITRLIDVDCPEPIIETRWKVRFDNRRFKDSLKMFRRIYSDSLDNAYKSLKNDNRTDRYITRRETRRSTWYIWLISGLVIGLTLKFLLKIFV